MSEFLQSNKPAITAEALQTIEDITITANGERLAIFDMDGTVYNPVSINGKPGFENSKLSAAVDQNARLFILDELGEADPEAILRQAKKDPVGISAYIESNYGVPRQQYFDTVWDLDPAPLIQVDTDLIAMLRSIDNAVPILLTAAPSKWQTNLLSFLRLDSAFAATISGDMYAQKDEVFAAFANKYPSDRITSIGDQIDTDIEPAYQQGMRVALVDTTTQTKRAIKRLGTPSIIIDTDPGTDDAVAITAAFIAGLPIIGLTTVFGNAEVKNSTENAQVLLAQSGYDYMQVYEGAPSPLSGQAVTANSQGNNGMGGFTMELPEQLTTQITANEYLQATLESASEPIDIMAIGPLTNIAELLSKRPELASKIGRVVIMGGVVGQEGNITPFAEFNTYNDPEALQQVLNSTIETVLIPADVCREVVFNTRLFADITAKEGGMLRAITAPYIDYYENNEEYGGFNGAVMYDLLATMYLDSPELFDVEEANITVTLEGEKRGQTAIQADKKNNTLLATNVAASKLETRYRDIYGI